MKDSGIEWIGEIPEEWTIAELKMFCIVNNGKEIINEVDKCNIDAIPVYGSGGIFKYTDNFMHDGTVVMFGRKGTLGKPIHVTGRFWVVDTMYYLTYMESLNPKYNYYQLLVFNWEPHITQTALPSVVASQIISQKFAFPPTDEQKNIVAYLDKKCAEIDAVLEKTRESIEEYKKLKQAVITEAVTKGVDNSVPMKDSGIDWVGEIPETWDVIKIMYVRDETHPYSLGDGDHGCIKAEDYLDEGIPYIRVQNIGWCSELKMDNVVYISEDDNNKIQNSILRPNDILFVKTGATIGKTAILPENIPIANTTSHVGKLTVAKKFNAKYILYVLSSYVGYRQFWNIASQKTTRPELAIDEIKTLRLLVPKSRATQDEIVEYIDTKCSEIDTLIAKKETLLEELDRYKKSLIYEYVSGKKQVVEA